jgi:hypothetical protein
MSMNERTKTIARNQAAPIISPQDWFYDPANLFMSLHQRWASERGHAETDFYWSLPLLQANYPPRSTPDYQHTPGRHDTARVVIRARGSHPTKSTQRAHACRQQHRALASIRCNNSISITSRNSQTHAPNKQEACRMPAHFKSKHKKQERASPSSPETVTPPKTRG